MNLIQNQQKMLDILFAKKNKAYGAYAIRSSYGETLFKSVAIVLITLSLTFGSVMYFQDNVMTDHEVGQVLQKDSILIIPFNLHEDKPDQPEPKQSHHQKPSEQSATSNATGLTEIRDNAKDTVENRYTNTDITVTSSVTNNSGGNESGTGTEKTEKGGSGSGGALDLFAVDENPEFEGGLNALLGFVRKHVKYPEVAVDNQKQGTLHVKFVVDEQGNISQIELLNQLGFGLDDEAKRVVSLIPKFKSPGKVKGKPVKTYYQLPIKFKLG